MGSGAITGTGSTTILGGVEHFSSDSSLTSGQSFRVSQRRSRIMHSPEPHLQNVKPFLVGSITSILSIHQNWIDNSLELKRQTISHACHWGYGSFIQRRWFVLFRGNFTGRRSYAHHQRLHRLALSVVSRMISTLHSWMRAKLLEADQY